MSDIELIITIPEEVKNKIDNANEDNYTTYIRWFETTLYCAIKNGTPLNDLRAEIESKSDRINSLASVLPYTAHREIQELLCEIMDLCKEGEGKE